MRIVAISDTHTHHMDGFVPGGDILVHAGDFTYKGRRDEIGEFLDWFLDLPHEHKVLIAGNHDIQLDTEKRTASNTILAVDDMDHWIHEEFYGRIRAKENVHYLENSGVCIKGINFWGSPITPTFGYGWGFNSDPDKIGEYWELIPEDTHVLVTHGPPFETLDWVLPDYKKVGCGKLQRRISQISPLIHIFGHIHESYGAIKKDGTTYFNASQLNHRYYHTNSAWVIDMNEREVIGYSN
jgi:Icc-related predicted phosphoesterase